MKVFEHVKIDLGYDDLVAETTPTGRKYIDPDGNTYPSITTVLSILSEEAIQAWRDRVGAEEANKISLKSWNLNQWPLNQKTSILMSRPLLRLD